MAVASVSTITSASPTSWQDAAELGFERARQTLRGITGIKVIEEKARVEDGVIIELPRDPPGDLSARRGRFR